ncbi:MAG: nitroreductase family protein, partial [Planctomycetes bacterium]|nr:nitroreductase family protein [Planctomycetota bacterium]
MQNPHYVNFNVPDKELPGMTEEVLMTMLRRESHLLDLTLQMSQAERYSGERLKSIQQKLEVYKKNYNTNKPDYTWAAGVAQLYQQALAEGERFSYPAEEIEKISIPEAEFTKLIKSRRSVRKFTEKPVAEETLRKIIDCANWAPTNCGIQALRYIVIKDAETRKQMKRTRDPYTLVVIADLRFYPDGDIECPYHDSGAAIQNMLLAFHYYGLGACYVSDTGI